MLKSTLLSIGIFMAISFSGCNKLNPKTFIKSLNKVVLKKPSELEGTKIIFLHHSTGNNIWNGGVEQWFENYNKTSSHKCYITEQSFPASAPYGWNNYPYDYWNIWVKHQGTKPYKKEPTLEMITELYDIIIFKHCFPVGNIKPNTGSPDVASPEKTIENYQLQYKALKEKMHKFPDKKFILWTGAALVESATNSDEAKRTQEFFWWVKNEWDQQDDNIFLWDFYKLETEGGLYLKPEYAAGPRDSHPNEIFSKKTTSLFCRRIIDIATGRRDKLPLSKEYSSN